MLIRLAMFPGMLLAGAAVMMDKKGIKSGFCLFGFLSAVYTFGVLTAWCLFVLFFFSHRGSESAGVPLLIWSDGAATGPIAYLAQKDMQSGNEYGALAAFFSQVAFILEIGRAHV